VRTVSNLDLIDNKVLKVEVYNPMGTKKYDEIKWNCK